MKKQLDEKAIVIRSADATEAEYIGELTERAYRLDGFLNVEGGEVYAQRLRDAAQRIRNANVLVATLDDQIVATVTLAAYGNPLTEIAVPGELEVRMLAVAPEARRRGIAEQLMRAAKMYAQSQGLNSIVLSTETPMNAAHKLYEKLLYVRQPERDWTVDGYELLVYRYEF